MSPVLHRLRPSPAIIVALLALVVALSGTSYAVAKLPKKSVGAAQLKTNAVTSKAVKNGSLTAADLKAGVLTAGPPGPQGATGATGPVGPQGPAGPSTSAFAQATRNPSFGIPTDDFTTMFGLTEFSQPSTGALVLAQPSRVHVAGLVNVAFPEPQHLYCRLQHRVLPAGGWQNLALVATTRTGGSGYDQLAVHHQLTLPAGSFDFRIQCRSSLYNAVQYSDGSLSVIATGA